MQSIDNQTPEAGLPRRRGNRRLFVLAGIAIGMLGFAFANVPLFRVFCTHLGIYVAQNSSIAAQTGPVDSKRTVDLLFSGVVAAGNKVEFQPKYPLQTAHIGQRMENAFTFYNPTDHPIRFRAIHDIYPYNAATHLALIQCFCFSDQTLGPHQRRTLPVIYQVNAGIDKDVNRIALNYTLYLEATK